MEKHYCDICGKELTYPIKTIVIKEYSDVTLLNEKEYEICSKCRKKAKRLLNLKEMI